MNIKNCSCKSNDWILIHSNRIDSLGTEKIEWCKNCGTIKKSSIAIGSVNERILDYRVINNSLVDEVSKKANNSKFYKE